jgi:transcriptional regulator with XRE-family HTH domain
MADYVPDHVPTVLRELMQSTGWTQGQLAAQVEVSQGTISKWLAGTQDPRKTEWDRVKALYVELKVEDSIDAKVRPYGPETRRVVDDMVVNYLSKLPRPPKR